MDTLCEELKQPEPIEDPLPSSVIKEPIKTTPGKDIKNDDFYMLRIASLQVKLF